MDSRQCSSLFLSLAAVICCSALILQALSTSFYSHTCPNVVGIVDDMMRTEMLVDPRIGASILRLHFQDCFVNGCDGSILLDDDGTTIQSEKNAATNINSLRGFEVVDKLKSAMEESCPGVVSCADILTLAARASVTLAGGRSWNVVLGRRDSRTANLSGAQINLPSPFSSLKVIAAQFSEFGLNISNVVALSGAHTFGRAHCTFIKNRLYNFNRTGKPDPRINQTYLPTLQKNCPDDGSRFTMTNLDSSTPDSFDTSYFTNLLKGEGVLQSDQELLSTDDAHFYVIMFSKDPNYFLNSFGQSMIYLGNIRPLTGKDGEIRKDCRKVNSSSLNRYRFVLAILLLIATIYVNCCCGRVI